ncbi:MAG: GNAT family N-acetyltransferase [Chloroflexota bacterium]
MHVLLETERLLLRRFTEDDVDNLFDLDSDPEVMRFLSGGKPTPRDVIQNETLPRFLRSSTRLEGPEQDGVDYALSRADWEKQEAPGRGRP